MKKTMMIIALFVVLIFTVSSRPDRDIRASRGYEAPELSLFSLADSSVIELSDLKGSYVLVNFWAASDAESRIAAHGYDQLTAVESPVAGTERLRLLQVNLDRSVRLFREIVRRDQLSEAQQFYVSPANGVDVKHKFNLDSGMQSYLIDPSGKVIAVNPTPEAVESLMST